MTSNINYGQFALTISTNPEFEILNLNSQPELLSDFVIRTTGIGRSLSLLRHTE